MGCRGRTTGATARVSGEKNRDLVFVLGAGKTATTALCGLLNRHPDVFIMCEVMLSRSNISRFGRKLLKADPALLSCFFRRAGADWLENYRQAHEILRGKGFAKRCFGDKLVGIDSNYAKDFEDTKVIYSVRRLPEWIAKTAATDWYPLDIDVVPFAAQYAKHFIESFLIPRIYHVRMEAFLEQNATLVRELWQFLEIDPPEKAEAWWEILGHYPRGDPKRKLNWWRGHATSAVRPENNDTKVQIRPNAFWAEILPIFDKYYDGIGQHFAPAEIATDLEKLQSMIGRHHQPFRTCFVVATTESRNPRLKKIFTKERLARKGRNKGIRGFLRALGVS
jgi:hypothetical protein